MHGTAYYLCDPFSVWAGPYCPLVSCRSRCCLLCPTLKRTLAFTANSPHIITSNSAGFYLPSCPPSLERVNMPNLHAIMSSYLSNTCQFAVKILSFCCIISTTEVGRGADQL